VNFEDTPPPGPAHIGKRRGRERERERERGAKK